MIGRGSVAARPERWGDIFRKVQQIFKMMGRFKIEINIRLKSYWHVASFSIALAAYDRKSADGIADPL